MGIWPFSFFALAMHFSNSWSGFILKMLFMEPSTNLTASCAWKSFLTTFDAQSLWKLKLKIITLISSTGTYYFLLLTVTAWSTCIHYLLERDPDSTTPISAWILSRGTAGAVHGVIACTRSWRCCVCHSHCWEPLINLSSDLSFHSLRDCISVFLLWTHY